MPGTGMSIMRVVTLTIWIMLLLYAFGLGAAFLVAKFPNPVTSQIYLIVTNSHPAPVAKA